MSPDLKTQRKTKKKGQGTEREEGKDSNISMLRTNISLSKNDSDLKI